MPERARLRAAEETAAFVRALHPTIKRKVKAGLSAILKDPACGKPLRGELRDLRSLRVGKFRIIYREGEKGSIDIVAVGPRRAIYEETYRLLKKPSNPS